MMIDKGVFKNACPAVTLFQSLDILKAMALQKLKTNKTQHFVICLADFTIKYIFDFTIQLLKMFSRNKWSSIGNYSCSSHSSSKNSCFMICRITLTCVFLHGFYGRMIEQEFRALRFSSKVFRCLS